MHIAREDDHLAMETQIHLGKVVQQMLLPEVLSGASGEISFQFHYNPSQSMSGDWIAEWKDNNGIQNIIIGDVVGKGPQAAIAVTAIMSVIHRARLSPLKMVEVLDEIHRFVGSLFKNHITTTATAVSISPQGKITLVNCAGQGWFISAGPESRPIPLRGSLIGSQTAFAADTFEVEMKPNERLFTFTDGVLDGTRSVMKFLRALKKQELQLSNNQELIELALKIGEKDVFEDDKAMLVLSRT